MVLGGVVNEVAVVPDLEILEVVQQHFFTELVLVLDGGVSRLQYSLLGHPAGVVGLPETQQHLYLLV